MNKVVFGVVSALALTIMSAGAAFAHHGLAQEFDMEKRVTLKGKISKVYWQNPHIYYTLDVTEKNGKVRSYNVESVPVAMARNAGLTAQKLRNGGKDVEIDVRPGLKDPNVVWGLVLRFQDGFVVTFEGFKE